MVFEFLKKKQDAPEVAMQKKDHDLALQQMGLQAAEQLSDQVALAQQEAREDITRWQQDLKDEMELLVHDLRQEVFDHKNGRWVPQAIFVGLGKDGKAQYQRIPPLMNDIGIAMVLTTIRPLMSRNLINTNLEEERVLTMLLYTSNTLVNNLASYHDQYGVDFANMSNIVRLIKNVIIPTPFRAMDDGERKHQRHIHKITEAHTDVGSRVPERQGLFSMMLSGKKR